MIRNSSLTARRARCCRWVGAVAIAAAAGAPLTAAASEAGRASTAGAAAAGVMYGGFTPQDAPVVVELSRDRRKVVRASIGLRLDCTSGLLFNLPDEYQNMPLSRRGRFGASFGPTKVDRDDGTSTEFQGSVKGATNARRTKLSGTWRLIATDRDAAGAVTDTCDSGTIAWRVKQ